MLQKRERLTKKKFDEAFLKGKRVHSPHLQLIFVPSSSFHGAAVVGKKVYKKAVARNKLRRQLYGALYRYHKTHKLMGTYILIAKPALCACSAKEISASVTDVLTRASK